MGKPPGSEGTHPIPESGFAARWNAFLQWLSRRPAVQLIVRVWSWIWTTVRMLWLCGYDVVAALVVLFLFVFNDQGRDLLRISAEQLFSWWNLMFLLGTAALALTFWYTARLLLGRDFPSYPLDLSNARRRQRWLPRIFGVSVPLSVAIGLTRIESDVYQLQIWTLAAVYLLLAGLVFEFFRRRRKWLDIPEEEMIERRASKLEGWDRILIWTAGVLSFVLLVAFMVWPVGLPQGLGAPAIVMLGFVGIVLFGSMALTYSFLAYGQPAATALVLMLAVVFGFWIDNHEVRLAGEPKSLNRSPPARHYAEWRAAHPDYTPVGGREPVVLVAAAGGGIRAAYWTAIRGLRGQPVRHQRGLRRQPGRRDLYGAAADPRAGSARPPRGKGPRGPREGLSLACRGRPPVPGSRPALHPRLHPGGGPPALPGAFLGAGHGRGRRLRSQPLLPGFC
jgi:hypothetical protein